MDIQRKRLVGVKILGGLLFLLMLTAQGHPNIYMDILGFLLILAAGLGRVWAASYIAGFKSGKVVQDGPYSVMRNPLYFFSFLGFAGVGLVFGSLILSVLLIGVFLITHLPIIKYEEGKLLALFGDEYAAYKEKTPRFFPKRSLFHSADMIDFYPKKFAKTLRESALLISSYGIVKLIVWMHQNDILPNLITLY
jgi:protein-S-isoprenylcysteine O-methyltransferase Ste14